MAHRAMAAPEPVPNNPVPRRWPQLHRPHQQYTHIDKPSFEQVLEAALLWAEIAEREGLEYAFVGSFAARYNAGTNNFLVHDIEILVAPETLVNNCERLTAIMHRNPNRLTITPSESGANRHIIVIDENAARGIALQLYVTGTFEFRDRLIAPRELLVRDADIGLTATYRYQSAPYPNQNIRFPILKFHLLLQQRLVRFDVNSNDQDICARNYRDIDDIQTFLHCTSGCRDYPFPPAVANNLLNTVRTYIRYAGGKCNRRTSESDLQQWRQLGIELNDADWWAQFYP